MENVLNHKICIYVPSTYDGNKPAKRMQKKAVKKAARLENVKTFAKAVCRWMKQEAVSIEIDNTLQFIEA